MFALPVLTPTFGILDWKKNEIKNMDIKTRKVLNMTGNFHYNSDVDRLYASRKESGRGLKMVKEAYESCIISISQHLHQSIQRNPYLMKVVENENKCIVRQAEEFLSVEKLWSKKIVSCRNCQKNTYSIPKKKDHTDLKRK